MHLAFTIFTFALPVVMLGINTLPDVGRRKWIYGISWFSCFVLLITGYLIGNNMIVLFTGNLYFMNVALGTELLICTLFTIFTLPLLCWIANWLDRKKHRFRHWLIITLSALATSVFFILWFLRIG